MGGGGVILSEGFLARLCLLCPLAALSHMLGREVLCPLVHSFMTCGLLTTEMAPKMVPSSLQQETEINRSQGTGKG